MCEWAAFHDVILLQVTVLDVLDQESALHLLPSMRKAPDCGCQSILAQTAVSASADAEHGNKDSEALGDEQINKSTSYYSKEGAESVFLQDRPKEAVDTFRRLLHEGRLRKAAELGSLAHDIAAHY